MVLHFEHRTFTPAAVTFSSAILNFALQDVQVTTMAGPRIPRDRAGIKGTPGSAPQDIRSLDTLHTGGQNSGTAQRVINGVAMLSDSDNPTSDPGGDRKDVKVIKRYSNRKLYDTVESRYVTLDEIAQMIQDGAEVKIVDNRSKEDLTSVTLAQIIFEQEKKKSRMPLAVLKNIIRHPGETIVDFVQKEVAPRVSSIKDEAQSRAASIKEAAEQRVGSLKEAAMGRIFRRGDEEGGGERASVKEVLAASQRAVEEWQKRIDDRIKSAVDAMGSIASLARDMSKLQARIDELEKKLEKLE